MASKIALKNNINSEFEISHSDGIGAVSVMSKDMAKINPVDTVAALRAMTYTPSTVWLSGYHEAGDGAFGSNIFRWNPDSTEADNGGTVIKLDSIATGRYELQYDGAVNVKWFGAVGDGVTDDTVAIQSAVDSGLPLYFDNSNYKSDIVMSGTNKAIHFDGTEIVGNIRVTAFYKSVISGNCRCANFEIFGIQRNRISGMQGDFMYIQNRVGVSGVYWNEFSDCHFNALQIRQAKLDSGTSAINLNKFNSCTFNNGDTNNTFTNASAETITVNVWVRDQDAENAEGGTYPTYTEDFTSNSFIGNDKWSTIYANPIEFDGLDTSYKLGGYDKSYGVLNESLNSILYINNAFIEDVTYPYNNNNVRATNTNTRNGSIIDVDGNNINSSGGNQTGNLAIGYNIENSNFEFKNPLKNSTFAGAVLEPISLSGIDTVSTGFNLLKFDNSGSSNISTTWYTYAFTAKKDGFITVAIRGINAGAIGIKVNAKPTTFVGGYSRVANKEQYTALKEKVSIGDSVLVFIFPPSLQIGYVTGFGVFYGSDFLPLVQDSLISHTNIPLAILETNQNAWSNLATITLGNYKKDIVKLECRGTIMGRGDFKGLIEAKLEADAVGVITVTELENIVSPTASGVQISAVLRVVSLVANTITIDVQKGFFGTSVNNVSIISLSQRFSTGSIAVEGNIYNNTQDIY